MATLAHLQLDPVSETPLYRQLAESIRRSILSGVVVPGDRLPATRELAAQLGLNRTTVSAAYALLEESGLLQGQVGRGSFVALGENSPTGRRPGVPRRLDWEAILPPLELQVAPVKQAAISFASSRPPEESFPLAEFRRLSKEVIDGPEAPEILQLGSPYGYAPLRRHLLEEARKKGVARPGDDLIVTNGCQQALDLLARVLVTPGTPVLLEDPVYHGLLQVFGRARAQLIPIPVGGDGLSVSALEAAATQHNARLLAVTPNFQNPTGTTLGLDQRRQIAGLAQRSGFVLVEIDLYGELRYEGQSLPGLKQLDETGNTILLGSYSKVAFPGLRVGWVIAPRPVIERLAEAKQISDLHSDQLSQAVLLRFAESGELERHLAQTKRAGAKRLRAVLDACEKFLPSRTQFTRPEGGMNLWVELPAPLWAESVLRDAEEQGVSFLPGSYFCARRSHERALRISFGSLSPGEITRGLEILGEVARKQLAAHAARAPLEAAAALV